LSSWSLDVDSSSPVSQEDHHKAVLRKYQAFETEVFEAMKSCTDVAMQQSLQWKLSRSRAIVELSEKQWLMEVEVAMGLKKLEMTAKINSEKERENGILQSRLQLLREEKMTLPHVAGIDSSNPLVEVAPSNGGTAPPASLLRRRSSISRATHFVGKAVAATLAVWSLDQLISLLVLLVLTSSLILLVHIYLQSNVAVIVSGVIAAISDNVGFGLLLEYAYPQTFSSRRRLYLFWGMWLLVQSFSITFGIMSWRRGYDSKVQGVGLEVTNHSIFILKCYSLWLIYGENRGGLRPGRPASLIKWFIMVFMVGGEIFGILQAVGVVPAGTRAIFGFTVYLLGIVYVYIVDRKKDISYDGRDIIRKYVVPAHRAPNFIPSAVSSFK
jgi:hypothetical protein